MKLTDLNKQPKPSKPPTHTLTIDELEKGRQFMADRRNNPSAWQEWAGKHMESVFEQAKDASITRLNFKALQEQFDNIRNMKGTK